MGACLTTLLLLSNAMSVFRYVTRQGEEPASTMSLAAWGLSLAWLILGPCGFLTSIIALVISRTEKAKVFAQEASPWTMIPCSVATTNSLMSIVILGLFAVAGVLAVVGSELRAKLEELNRSGFVRVGRLLDADTLDRVRTAMDREGTVESVANPYGVIRHNPWTRHSELRETLHSSAITRVIGALLESSEVIPFQDVLVSKPDGTTSRVEWHQDFAYWPLSAPHGLTLWIALDDADVENGCLHYIPGTHILGECQPTDFVIGAVQALRTGLPPLNAPERESEAVAVALTAGEALVHHPLIWHMSPPNMSGRPRRAWTSSWIHPDVRFDPAHAPHPFTHELGLRLGDAVVGELFPRLHG
jgi:ectoine hydroxylase-related dioxygenase (phytanoyl-CoA dioxygenase family)